MAETNGSAPAEYDAIAADYKACKAAPFRTVVEQHTMVQVLLRRVGAPQQLPQPRSQAVLDAYGSPPLDSTLGTLGSGAIGSVLDLACGEGVYSRLLMSMGATRVVGVDLSPEMIKLARAHPVSGCSFLVGDAETLDLRTAPTSASVVMLEGGFDVVLAMFLLNYARSEVQLLAFLRTARSHLRPGGAMVGFNDFPGHPVELFDTYAKYGFRKEVGHGDSSAAGQSSGAGVGTGAGASVGAGAAGGGRAEGSTTTYHLFNGADGEAFSFTNFYLSLDTYERCFAAAGFTDFAWHGLEADQTGAGFPEGFWDHLVSTGPFRAFSATAA